jgi:hypothetical protein
MIEGLNTDIRHRGRVYHVQSQPSFHPTPALETVVCIAGEVLVRMRSTLPDGEEPRWSAADARHVLELQHWNLVRKIRHGLLDEASPSGPVEDRAGPASDASRPDRTPGEGPAGLATRASARSSVPPRRRSGRWPLRLAVVVRW